MSVEDTVKHCIETSLEEDWDYKIEEYEDEENTVILHAHIGFLTPDLTEELRRRLIFVDATSSSYEDDYSVMYFLHYLEPEEDTFMDSLAEPVSTANNREVEELVDRFKKSGRDILEDRTKPLTELYHTKEDLISEEELDEVEGNLEGAALDLFQRLVDNALDRDEFYEILNEERVGTDWHRVREALQDVGGYTILDIRMSEKVRKLAEGGSSD